jgi:dipeptidyl aminopeptidase/acylaminoacyl peptidase
MKRASWVLFVVACGGSKPAPVESPVEPTTPPVVEPAPPPVAATPKPQGRPDPNLIPREVLFGNPERAGVELSPDGKYLSWTAPVNGVMNLWVAPVGKLDAAKPITKETTRPIRQYFWAYDKQHLLFVQDAGGDENWHLFRTKVDGSDVTDLTPYPGARTVVYSLSPKKPKTVIVGINDRDKKVSDVYSLDLSTGKRTLLYENTENFTSFNFDHDLALRLAQKLTPEGGEILQRKAGKWVPWQKIAFEDTDGTRPAGFDATGKRLYMIDSRGRETAALVSVALDGKAAPKLVAEHPKADLGDVLDHPTKYTPQAVGFMYDRMKWTALDKTIQPDLDGLTKLAEGGDWNVNSRSLDDKKWLVVVSADVSPPRYFLWDRAKHAGTFLFAAQPKIPTERLSKMHPVIIKSRDGLDMVSYLTLPKAADPDGDGKANTPVPMVLWVHGGPWGRDRWGFNRNVQLFADRGYAVLQVNFRASTGFGKAFLNAGDRQWSKKMHDDLLDGVEWAIKAGVAPKDKICIGGVSYGGYATLVGLAMTPEVFACGVDVVGPSNISSLIAATPAYWKPAIARIHRRMGNPDDPKDKVALDAASPLTHAAKITRPLLIGQGANDPRVPKSEAEQVVAAMKKSNLPVSYIVFPDEGHGFARPQNNIAFMAITEAFLSAHLGGTYLPITKEELAASSMKIENGREHLPGI